MSNTIETGLSFTSRRKFLFLAGSVVMSTVLEACGFQEPEVIGIHNGTVEIKTNIRGEFVNVRKYPSLQAEVISWKPKGMNSSYLPNYFDNIKINFPEIVRGDNPDLGSHPGYWIKLKMLVNHGIYSTTSETLYISWSDATADYINSSLREIVQKDKSGKYIHPATGALINDRLVGEQVFVLR